MSAPAAATWLLKKFRQSDDALLGDLLEECPNGRSTAWFWRQVVGAIVTGLRKDLQDHPMLALRAMAAGWIVLLLFFACGDVFAETWRGTRGIGTGGVMDMGPECGGRSTSRLPWCLMRGFPFLPGQLRGLTPCRW